MFNYVPSSDDDLITIENIQEDKVPIIRVFQEPDGSISFSSRVSPQNTAKIFAGLLNHIMEREIG